MLDSPLLRFAGVPSSHAGVRPLVGRKPEIAPNPPPVVCSWFSLFCPEFHFMSTNPSKSCLKAVFWGLRSSFALSVHRCFPPFFPTSLRFYCHTETLSSGRPVRREAGSVSLFQPVWRRPARLGTGRCSPALWPPRLSPRCFRWGSVALGAWQEIASPLVFKVD